MIISYVGIIICFIKLLIVFIYIFKYFFFLYLFSYLFIYLFINLIIILLWPSNVCEGRFLETKNTGNGVTFLLG